MAEKYIVLATQDGTLSKRFRVVEGGFQKQMIKASNLARTITGKLDQKSGSILTVYSLILRVRHTEENGTYGTKAQLEELFGLNNPADANTPDLLRFTDHYGTTVDAYLGSEMSISPLTTMISGTTAWFFMQVMIIVKP